MDPRETPTADENPRCWNCGRMLGIHLTRSWSIKCPRCKQLNERNVRELGRRQGSMEQKEIADDDAR